MKTKEFNKVLVLNKKTIANLSKNSMEDVHGGADTAVCFTEGEPSCISKCPMSVCGGNPLSVCICQFTEVC